MPDRNDHLRDTSGSLKCAREEDIPQSMNDWDFIFGRCTLEEAGLTWPKNTLPENDKSIIISPKFKITVQWDKFDLLNDQEREEWGRKIDELHEGFFRGNGDNK